MRAALTRTVSRIFHHTGLWKAGFLIHRLVRKGPVLVVFTFHRVTTEERSARFLMGYERGVDQRVFETQIRAIRRYFRVITLDRFIEAVSGRCPLESNSALLTFDDADAEFQEYALPILEKYDCASTLFAPTAFVGTDRRFWHLRLSNLLMQMSADAWSGLAADTDTLPAPLVEVIESIHFAPEVDRTGLCGQMASVLDTLPHQQTLDIISHWEKKTGIDYQLGIRCMTWDELREMTERGVSVEAHTITHRKLAFLGRDEIRTELADSKKEIEDRLGRPVRAICYPAGSHNETVAEVAAECGYEAGFGTLQGVCDFPPTGWSPTTIRRLNMRGLDRYDAAWYVGAVPLRACRSGGPWPW